MRLTRDVLIDTIEKGNIRQRDIIVTLEQQGIKSGAVRKMLSVLVDEDILETTTRGRYRLKGNNWLKEINEGNIAVKGNILEEGNIAAALDKKVTIPEKVTLRDVTEKVTFSLPDELSSGAYILDYSLRFEPGWCDLPYWAEYDQLGREPVEYCCLGFLDYTVKNCGRDGAQLLKDCMHHLERNGFIVRELDAPVHGVFHYYHPDHSDKKLQIHEYTSGLEVRVPDTKDIKRLFDVSRIVTSVLKGTPYVIDWNDTKMYK